jgi:hypothetical protein
VSVVRRQTTEHDSVRTHGATHSRPVDCSIVFLRGKSENNRRVLFFPPSCGRRPCEFHTDKADEVFEKHKVVGLELCVFRNNRPAAFRKQVGITVADLADATPFPEDLADWNTVRKERYARSVVNLSPIY